MAAEKPIRASVTASGLPWAPGAGWARHATATTKATAAALSGPAHRGIAWGRPGACSSPGALGVAGASGLTTKPYGRTASASSARPREPGCQPDPPAGGGPPPAVQRADGAQVPPRRRRQQRSAGATLSGRRRARRNDMNSTAGEPRPDQAAAGAALPGPVISIRGLVKRYGSQEAVRGIDLDVHQGEIFAFLGPNGAGKTTTVEILEGFRQRSDGEVTVLGADPARAGGAWRDRVGVVLQESKPEPGLSVRECLELYAGFYSAPRDIDETITLVGLDDKKRTHADKLSGGQLRRLDFALALIVDPELIFLDEPTTGFDPSARRAAWEVIAGLRDLGKTIFLTTHYMDEAEYLADRIAVIAAGRIVAQGTPRTLGGRDRMMTTISFTLPAPVTARDLPDGLAPLAEAGPGESTVLRSESPLAHLHMLSEWALGRGFDLPDLDVHRPGLEEVYLSLTSSTSTKESS